MKNSTDKLKLKRDFGVLKYKKLLDKICNGKCSEAISMDCPRDK